MREIRAKIGEVLAAIAPIVAVVLISHLTFARMEPIVLGRFLVGTLFIMAGLTLFLFGVDIGISPIGSIIGSSITLSGSMPKLLASGLVLGFFVSAAEPDLHILALQVSQVTGNAISRGSLVIAVSLGIAALLALGLLRIIKGIHLNRIFAFLYGIILLIAIFSPKGFLAIAFDSSGATTGAMTVPFILALARGVSSMKKDSLSSEEDSFGLVAIASAGAIMAVLIMGMFSHMGSPVASASAAQETSLIMPFIRKIPTVALEVSLALIPIIALYLVLKRTPKNMSRKLRRGIITGLGLTLVGLVLFLTGVSAGFMDAGMSFGRSVASAGNGGWAVILGFILGFTTVMAEPAVYALTHQIQEVTSGYVRRATVLLMLSLGVGLAVALSIVRIQIPGIQIWHYLLPGYIISIGLSFLVPHLFVGMAFDAGGVASGPMSVTFILAYTHGVAYGTEQASVLIDGFGMIAMIAMMPIIAVQVLGLVYRLGTRRRR